MVRIVTPPGSRRAFTQEQIARFFFAPVVDDNDDRTGSWRCRVCSRTYRQEIGRGYTNLVAHLAARHDNYMDRLLEASASETGSIGAWVSQRATVRFGHLELTVETGLPLSFSQQPAVRRYLNLPPISYETLRDTIMRMVPAVEARIAQELPPKFGIIFDGWSHDSEHYLAFFATYDDENGVVQTPLLSMAPIINEPGDSHDAESHVAALAGVLELFDASVDRVAFLVGDNCSVNKKFARLVGVPLVGCSSHRLNLAVRTLMDEYEAELDNIHQLMIKLRGLNQAAQLRFRTDLRPVIRQDTRWSSTFSMLLRFFELREHLNGDDDVIADLLPSPARVRKLKTLLDQMKMIESVSKRLQGAGVSMRDTRLLFDALVEQFPAFGEYLGPTASIIASPAFETAIVRLQSGHRLSRSERSAVEHMRVAGGTTEQADDSGEGFAERALKRARVSEEPDRYVLVPAVVPTSNVAERLFSQARAMIGLDRHRLQPIMMEAILFLKINRPLWDVHTVHGILEQDD